MCGRLTGQTSLLDEEAKLTVREMIIAKLSFSNSMQLSCLLDSEKLLSRHFYPKAKHHIMWSKTRLTKITLTSC